MCCRTYWITSVFANTLKAGKICSESKAIKRTRCTRLSASVGGCAVRPQKRGSTWPSFECRSEGEAHADDRVEVDIRRYGIARGGAQESRRIVQIIFLQVEAAAAHDLFLAFRGSAGVGIHGRPAG